MALDIGKAFWEHYSGYDYEVGFSMVLVGWLLIYRVGDFREDLYIPLLQKWTAS